MPARTVFVDTVALLALVNRDDAFHDAARYVLDGLVRDHVPLVTSDWVLAEFLGGAARVPLRESSCRAVLRIRRSRQTEVIPATRSAWEQAFELYQSRPDKNWSLVDCASILACQQRRIEEVFTTDKHFVQAGLAVLLKASV